MLEFEVWFCHKTIQSQKKSKHYERKSDETGFTANVNVFMCFSIQPSLEHQIVFALVGYNLLMCTFIYITKQYTFNLITKLQTECFCATKDYNNNPFYPITVIDQS